MVARGWEGRVGEELFNNWVWEDEFMEMGYGNGCKTMWIYLIPLNWAHKNYCGKFYVMCIFPQ